MNDTGTKNMDDLASLFLPDILHPLQSSSNTPGATSTSNPSNQTGSLAHQQPSQPPIPQQSPQQGSSSVGAVKSEEFDSLSADFNLLHRDSITSHSNTPPTSTSNAGTGSGTGTNNVTNFSDFLHNNNFINNNANNAHLLNQSFNSPLASQPLANNNAGGTNMDSIDQSLQQAQQQQSQQQQQHAHLHNYANFMNFEQNGGMMHHYQHHQQLMTMYGPQYQQIYQNQPLPQHQPQQQSQSQQQSSQSPQSQQQASQQSQGQFNAPQSANAQQMYQQSSMNASASTTFLNNYPFARTPNAVDWYDGLLGNGGTATNPNVYNPSSTVQFPRSGDISGYNQPYDQTQQLSSQQGSFGNLQQPLQSSTVPEQSVPQHQADGNDSNDSSPNLAPKKKKLKAKKIKDIISSEYQIDYKPSKLRQLLDFKRVENTMKRKDYKIVDKDNNNINIDFNGFLNGRFITNDNDNIYYLLTKKKTDNEHEKLNSKETTIKEDPKVISCYRRNYISIAINMNINGFKNSKSKLLKLQTSEYGYTITRVIKYFKIEISANISNKGNVPIFIKGKKMKDKKAAAPPPINSAGTNSYEFKDDLVQPSYINSREHIVILNDETAIENGQIDNYFIVKKIQFKNATPNNGNLAFQNYYHFKVKFSCVVADLYYDDYVDDELNNGLNGNTNNQNTAGNAGVGDNNEITLFELVSEPITVRGRNPSFYAERKDVTIKGRSNTSKKSFKRAGRSGLNNNNNNNNNEEDEDDYDYHGDDLKDHDGDDLDEDDEEDDDPSSANANRENSPNSSSAEDEPSNGKAHKNNEQSQGSGEQQLQQQLQVGDQIPANPPLSPLAYTTTQSTIDLKSVNRYKYFPISNVYYLPPINVVYFPHRAHQYQQGQIEDVTAQEEEAVANERRKSSNVYFK